MTALAELPEYHVNPAFGVKFAELLIVDSRETLRSRSVPALAAILMGFGGLWYVSLGLNHFYDANRLAGLPFFWTAVLGLCPFVCLCFAALLVDNYRRSRGAWQGLFFLSLGTALSPWMWLLWNYC